MKTRLAILGMAAVLGGCASVGDPIPLGPNSYMIRANTKNEETSIRLSAEKANQFCSEQGMTANIGSIGEAGYGRANVRFQCVKKSN